MLTVSARISTNPIRTQGHVEASVVPDLAAQVALLKELVMQNATGSNRDAMLRWLTLTGSGSTYDTPETSIIRSEARRLAKQLEDAGSGGLPRA